MERDISRAEKSQAEKARERKELESERSVLIREKARLDILVKDMETTAVDNDKRRKTLGVDIKKVDAEIVSKEQELGKVVPEFQKLKDEENGLSAELVSKNHVASFRSPI